MMTFIFVGCSSGENESALNEGINVENERNIEGNNPEGEIEMELEEEQNDDEMDDEAKLEEEEDSEKNDAVFSEKVGNYNGNIFMGGHMDDIDNYLYIVGHFGGEYGIYKLSLDEETVELVVELDSWSVGDLHVTEVRIYFVDRSDENDIFHFYSFDDGEIGVIAEGIIQNPLLTDGVAWCMMEHGSSGNKSYFIAVNNAICSDLKQPS